ncbi:MAG: NADP-specific glutamate dehydrogenase [Microthrixaceae bacterium]
MSAALSVDEVIEAVIDRSPHQPEFHQALRAVAAPLAPFLAEHPILVRLKILERMCEPEREVIFRVPWVDDAGEIHIARGYRVQFNSALGPYKGGLRFHPTVNLSVMKFLGLEQTMKNALTGLGLGSAKGGSDFDPKGRTDGEVMRFCQSFMTSLYGYIGHDLDVPAGDIGVSTREIGFLFGQYRRLTGHHESGVLTGKGLGWGGAALRTEATGYGLVYFTQHLLESRSADGHLRHLQADAAARHGRDVSGFAGATVIVSGAGNVAVHAIEKAVSLGARVVACSDSTGTLLDEAGIDVRLLKTVKLDHRGSLEEYAAERPGAEVRPGHRVWEVPCDVALACATQNELDEDDAATLIDNGCIVVAEGANMPCTPGAVARFRDAGVAFGPGKAANAGGVAVSGFEMRQNAARDHWSVCRRPTSASH